MKKKILIIITCLIGALLILIIVLNITNRNHIAFYDYNKVYNDCSLKKELEKDLLSVVNQRKSELDSMQLELSLLSERIKSKKSDDLELSKFEDLKNRYLTFQSKYEEENIRLKESYFAQIRKEINEKSKTYAEQNGYDFFFSAVGDGALMYAKPDHDVTEDFLKFVDSK